MQDFGHQLVNSEALPYIFQGLIFSFAPKNPRPLEKVGLPNSQSHPHVIGLDQGNNFLRTYKRSIGLPGITKQPFFSGCFVKTTIFM